MTGLWNAPLVGHCVDIRKSGHLSVREIGTSNEQFPAALPVIETETKAQAEALIVSVAKRQSMKFEGGEYIPGDYVIPGFGGTAEDISKLKSRFRELLNKWTAN